MNVPRRVVCVCVCVCVRHLCLFFLFFSSCLLFCLFHTTDTKTVCSLYFCVLQGFVQLVQNRYQKQRHYTLMSLGRASPMDITSTETISEPPPSSLMIVLVPVFLSQSVQIYIGYLLLRVCFVDLNVWQSPSMYREEMQTFSTGVLAVILGIGNFIATVNTLREKIKRASNPNGDEKKLM